MRSLLTAPRALAALLAVVALVALAPAPLRAADAVAACEDFFAKFQTCVDGLKGEQQQEARIFLKTLRGTVGMADGVNRGDPQLTGMLCGVMIDEAKKDPGVKKYNCTW